MVLLPSKLPPQLLLNFKLFNDLISCCNNAISFVSRIFIEFPLVTQIRHGKVYVTIAKKILDKGNDYTKKETERLQRMLEKVGNDYLNTQLLLMCPVGQIWLLMFVVFSLLQSISPTKADEFTIKNNVLSTFSS